MNASVVNTDWLREGDRLRQRVMQDDMLDTETHLHDQSSRTPYTTVWP